MEHQSSKGSDLCLINYSSSLATIGLPSVRINRINPIIQPSLRFRPKSGLDSLSKFLPHIEHLTAATSHTGLGKTQHESSDSEIFLTNCKRMASCFVHGDSPPAKRPVILDSTNQPETVHIPKPMDGEPYARLIHPKNKGIIAKSNAIQ